MSRFRRWICIGLFIACFVGFTDPLTWAAEPSVSLQERETVKQALLKVFEAEIKQTSALKDFLIDETQAPFKSALADLRAKRGGGELAGLTAWIQKSKKWYIVATGIGDYIPPTAGERQIVQQALQTVFSEEIKTYPTLKEFLWDESKRTFKHALADLRAERDGGGLLGVTSWIGKVDKEKKIDNKGWYLSYCGITEFMKKATPAPPPPVPNKKTPVIDNVHPDEAAPGMEVFIFGENFDGFRMAYYDTTVMACKYRAPTEIECYIPDDIKANGTIKVVTDDGEAVFGKQFGAHVAPEITGIKSDFTHPYEDLNTHYTGDKITIEGKNFINQPEVSFGNNKAASVRVVSRNALEVIVPNMAAGTYTLKVKTSGGEERRDNVKILARALPSITSAPATVGSGDEFTIQGKNLKNVVGVYFISGGKSKDAKDIVLVSDQQMRLKAPKETGAYSLEVKTSWGRATWPVGVEKRLPTIASIAPDFSPEGGRQLGKLAVIEGSNLLKVTEVKIGNRKEAIKHQTDTAITLRDIEWGMDPNQINQTVTLITADGDKVSKALISPPEGSVIRNSEGHLEKCFPAVGNACSGKSDTYTAEEGFIWIGPFKMKGGCSAEFDGAKKNCWVVPGSIKHDNCCLRNPLGKRCGGTFTSGPYAGQKASAPKGREWEDGPNNGKCASEWDDATSDVLLGRAWMAEFNKNDDADLTPVASSRYVTLKHGYDVTQEVKASQNFCAWDYTTISARHGVGFCCSGKGTLHTLVPPLVEDWITCGDPPSLIKDAVLPPPKLDLSQRPPDLDLGLRRKDCPTCNAYPITNTNPLRSSGARSISSMSVQPPMSIQQLDKNPGVDVLYPLIVEKSFAGTITSSPDAKKLECRDDKCLAYLKQGEIITLTIASSDPMMMLSDWGVEDCVSKKDLSCKVTMNDKGKVVKPVFKKNDVFTLTIERPQSGKVVSEDGKINCGIASCAAEYKEGTKATLKAVPDAEYKMTGWTGACGGKELQCILGVNENKKVGALFLYEKPAPKETPPPAAPVAQSAPKKPDGIKAAGNEIKPAIAEEIRPTMPEEQPAPVLPPVEEKAPSTGQPCNPSIPKYQQPGCVEQSEQQKRSPYDGEPCPDDSVPNYAKIGCIP